MHIITQEETEKFKKFLDSHESFIIAGHKEPDGDCIASMPRFGKDDCLYIQDSVLYYLSDIFCMPYSWLPEWRAF